MMNRRAYTYVRANIDTDTKERAAAVLATLGLTIPDAIRSLMTRIAEDGRLPFDVRRFNTSTIEAINQLETGNAIQFTSVEELMADLKSDD